LAVAISVSERAVQEIKRAAGKRTTTPSGLRVGIRGGGCTGFSYLFEWSDSEPRAEDKVLSYEDGRVRVFVDPKSFVFLDGSTLDYATTLMARGFKWVNPNAKGTCGCGESVQF
jgi:iron-sulfur cluster assembly protein